MSIRILHFSDLHLSGDASNQENTKARLGFLFDSLIKIQEKDGKAVDLVVFTGDLINKGGKDFPSISQGFSAFEEQVLRPLIEKVGINPARIVFLPGNHDTESSTKEAKRGKRNLLEEHAHRTEGEINAILNIGDEDKDLIIQRTKEFKLFERSYYSRFNPDEYSHSDFESNFIYNIDGIRIGITALNSVWLYGETKDNEKDAEPVYLGTDQLTHSIGKLKDCELKIVASHYPFGKLFDEESEKTYEKIAKHYDVCLAGHTHSNHAEYRYSSSGGHFLDITSAGTLDDNVYEDRSEYKNSFQVIDYCGPDDVMIRVFKQFDGNEFNQDMNLNGGKGYWKQPYNEEEVKKAEERRIEFEKIRRENVFLETIHPFLPIDKAIEEDKKTFQSGEFIETDLMRECIARLQDDSQRKLRLMALSGMGKTRCIGEAFRGRADVFYSPTAKNLDGGLHFLLRNRAGGVIIIDDCPIEEYNHIETLVEKYDKPFKIISIINVLSTKEAGTEMWNFFLDDSKNGDVIDSLIERSDIQNEEVKAKIKEYSEGIALMAIELINAYKSIGEVTILPDKNSWLNRLLDSTGKVTDENRKVLDVIALFNPLGYVDNKSDELEYVIQRPYMHHIGATDEGMVREIFFQTIHEFRQRRLLEVRANSLNIRPRPLAEWLAEEWLQNTPEDLWLAIINDFEASGKLGEILVRQIKNRIQPMNSGEAQKLISELNKRPFHDEKIVLTKSGSQIIFSMSSVSQCAVAQNLFALLKDKDSVFLRKEVDGDIRRNLVWALEECCFESEAFEDACKTLGLLAVAENEEISNNATGVFLEKFHILLSGTKASLQQRENVLDFLRGKGPEYSSLLVRAVNCAFETRSLNHMMTRSERKNNYQPEVSVKFDVLHHYWEYCKELLFGMHKESSVLPEIYKMLPNHVYDLVNNRCKEILFEMIDFFSPIFNNDWDEMRRALGWIKNFNPIVYKEEKERISKYRDIILAPKSFVKRMKAAIEDLDRKDFGSEQIFEAYTQALRPFGEEFIKNKIYGSEELAYLADNDDVHAVWMIITAITIMDREECRDEVYDAFLRHIENKPKEYRSSFFESFFSRDGNKDYLSKFKDILLDKGYYVLASSMMGMIETPDYKQLNRLFGLVHNKTIPSTYINNYLRFIIMPNVAEIFKVSDMLFDNEEVDRVEVSYHFLFQYSWSIKKEDIEPFLLKYENRLLEYDFENGAFYMSQQIVEHIEKILKIFNDPEFARRVNQRVIAFSKDYRRSINNPFEQIYFHLMPKYQDVVLGDVLDVLSAPIEDSMFFYNMSQELGSGFGYGAGPLFQCDNNKLKEACIKQPEVLPERLANMCPVCNFDENGAWTGLSDFFIWLVNNFGDNKNVLDNFSSNVGTYGFSAVGSMKGYYTSRADLFKPLFEHPNAQVAQWARMMYKSEQSQANYEQFVDDYRNVTGG